MFERRVEICKQLPANHPFQPPNIEPLQMILPDPAGETVVPASVQVAASLQEKLHFATFKNADCDC